MRINNILGTFMRNFGHSKAGFLRDRALITAFMDNVYYLPDKVTSSTRSVDLSRCTTYVVSPPSIKSNRSILYFHGGAMCLSLWKFYLPLVYKLATNLEATVIMPDYRLAPEHPFPSAIEDSIEALEFVLDNFNNKDVTIVGDSAGGNLALNVTLEHPDRIGRVCLMSPWLDLTHTSEYFDWNSSDDRVFRESADRAAWLYTMGDIDWSFGATDPDSRLNFARRIRDPRVSPLFADIRKVSNIPFLIQASRSERLVGDSISLFKHLGGRVEESEIKSKTNKTVLEYTSGIHRISLWPDEPHVWQITRSTSLSAKSAIEDITYFVRDQEHSPQ
jgi:monoterpene epsilon-lactone hydrolase